MNTGPRNTPIAGLNGSQQGGVAAPLAPRGVPPQKVAQLLDVKCMDQVQPEETSWLSAPYIPLGKLTSIEGDPGIGKTFLTCNLAAAWSRGVCPLSNDILAREQRILMITAEDGLADTISPRLLAAEAKLSNIVAVESSFELNSAGIETLDQAIVENTIDVVFLDPLTAFMGPRMDINKANHVRELTKGLSRLAALRKIAIIPLRHLTKGGRDKALYRGLGSIDIAAAFRSILMVGFDPDDEQQQRRIIAHAKSNLAARGPSLSFVINDGKFKWTGPVDHTAETLCEIPNQERRQSALAEAEHFLLVELGRAPAAANRVTENARARGIADRTLLRAKASLQVRSVKEPAGWRWELPPTAEG